MFEQLKSWSSKRKQQKHRRPRPRTILNLEALEERWCPAGDTYTWNPGNVNTLASNPANWEKNKVQQNANGSLPGANANDTVVLDGKTSQKNIEWNQGFTFSTMNLTNAYIGDQIIDTKVAVDLTGDNGSGSVNAAAGALGVKFADNTGTLTIHDNSTIAAFTVFGASGTVAITGGKTTICTGAVKGTSEFGGTLKISDATLEDKGQTQLALIGGNTTIQIDSANLQVDGGAGNTLISEDVAGSNDYIDVGNAGILTYLGKAGVTDTITTPVLVESGGTFTLNGGGGGTLTVSGKEQGTNNVSVYSSGTINLSNGITLNASSGLQATSISHVATLDSQTESITVAHGYPCTIDGSLQIDTASGTFGHLTINRDTLNFDGTLTVAINGDSDAGQDDELTVVGVLDLGPDSVLNIEETPSTDSDGPEYWVLINTTAAQPINGNFGSSNAAALGLITQENSPVYGNYDLEYP